MPKYGTVSPVLLQLIIANANFLSKELLKQIVLRAENVSIPRCSTLSRSVEIITILSF